MPRVPRNRKSHTTVQSFKLSLDDLRGLRKAARKVRTPRSRFVREAVMRAVAEVLPTESVAA